MKRIPSITQCLAFFFLTFSVPEMHPLPQSLGLGEVSTSLCPSPAGCAQQGPAPSSTALAASSLPHHPRAFSVRELFICLGEQSFKSQLCFEVQLESLSSDKEKLLLLLPGANKGQLMWHGMQNRGSPGFQGLRL